MNLNEPNHEITAKLRQTCLHVFSMIIRYIPRDGLEAISEKIKIAWSKNESSRTTTRWRFISSGKETTMDLLRWAAQHTEKETNNRIVEKKPPMAVINLGTDVDAPRGETI